MKKKLLCVLCTLLSIVWMAGAALAAETFTDIYALYSHWSQTGKTPGWVCSVSSTDGSGDRLTVVVTSSAAEEELRGLLDSTETLTVVVSDGGYTQTQLLQVKDEIAEKYLIPDGGKTMVGIGVGWATIDGVVTGFGESGHESRVVVSVLEEYAEYYRALFREQYGEMVYVEASGPAGLTAGTVTGDAGLRQELALETPANRWYLWSLAALLCGFGMLPLYRRHAAAAQTADGRTVAEAASLTSQQVESAVAEATVEPPCEAYEKILKKLEQPKNV